MKRPRLESLTNNANLRIITPVTDHDGGQPAVPPNHGRDSRVLRAPVVPSEDLKIAPNMRFFTDALANNDRDLDSTACEFMTKSLRRHHILTTLTFAAANGAHSLLIELAWAPLTPLPSHCFDTFALTFRVENKTNTGSWIAEHLVPTPTDFQLARPKILARYREHVIPIFDRHMIASSRIPMTISRISRPNFTRDVRSPKSPIS